VIPDGRTPVVVVTGFLGSGKTTLVNRLVKATDSLVIVNEFGEVPVDHVLIESSVEKAVALPNGCLCCHMRGDLEETLMGAAMRRRRGEIAGFDRVIVETSGLADPGPVAQTLYADPALQRDFKLGPIVTVVDAFDVHGRAAAAEIARAQIAAADVVVLSKVDRGNSADAEAEVRALNPSVSCIPADHGNVDPAAILEAKPGTEHDFSGTPAHGSAIRSFVMRFNAPVRRELLQQFLGTLVDLRGKDLLRVKGIVPLEHNQFVVVQGVRHVFARLQPVERGEPALVFITNGIEQGEVEALWRAMKGLS
jgi:G3E family GTPase